MRAGRRRTWVNRAMGVVLFIATSMPAQAQQVNRDSVRAAIERGLAASDWAAIDRAIVALRTATQARRGAVMSGCITTSRTRCIGGPAGSLSKIARAWRRACSRRPSRPPDVRARLVAAQRPRRSKGPSRASSRVLRAGSR